MQRDNYSLLIEKLDAFIRKFYVNQLLRGALYFVGLSLGLFITLNVLEYYFYFPTGVRTAMLWGFVGISGISLWRWVGLPLLHYFHLGKVISHEQAAAIVGNHFTDVKDKLLNILQLKQQAGNNAIYNDLIEASINQKSEAIRLVPFQSAIDLGRNRKHLRWALPPLALLLFLMQCAPSILKDGSMRLWNSNVAFEKPAPFRFIVPTDSMRVVQFSDYILKVKTEGAALPNEMFIDLGKVQYRMTKDAANEFSYKFTNVQQEADFKLFAGGLESREYMLDVIKKPGILSFDARLKFPEYIGRPSENLANVGDLVVPQGTNIMWAFEVQNTDRLDLRFSSGVDADAKRNDDNLFTFGYRAMKDAVYRVYLSNANVPNGDSVAYTITVVPDLHPQIGVQEFKDSTNNRLIYFAGDASDDYGLQNLTFNYQIKKAVGGLQALQTVKVDKQNSGKQTQYTYNWELNALGVAPGDEITYYFEIFDNDGVNGSKSARTNVMQWRMASLDEYHAQQASNSEEIKKDLDKALRESLKIQEELRKLREKALQQKELDWQTKKEMERLINRQKELQQQIQQAQQTFEENIQQQQEFSQQDQEMMEKQEQLQKLFEEALSEETKQLIEDIEKLMQELNKDQMLEQMEKMEMSSEELSKELDRLQELYKRLDVENLLKQQIEQLEQMAKQQEKLAEQTEKNAKPQEELKKEQDELNKKMEDMQKKQDELEKKNDELKKPKDVPDMKEDMKDAKQDMKDSKQDMEKNENSKASKSQKKAANKMKNMANKMKSAKMKGDMKQIEEDIATLRQILENLVNLSFSQERNKKDVETTTINTPRYVELTQQQYKIKEDFRLVEDSLQAMAKRNFQIESFITEKVGDIKGAMKTALHELEERNTPYAGEHQQRSMKGMNDLALMLSEALNNMQQQMAGMMPGGQNCQKPGAGSDGDGQGPPDKMSKGQGDLNEQMKNAKKRMDDQKGDPSSKEFAQMAAKQAALRNQLRELQKKKQQQGKGSKALDELMQKMDESEKEMVNKRLTNETLRRQQDIMVRLLEEERAEREQDQDEKRQAKTAEQVQPQMPPALEEYLKKRRAEVDLYRTVSPSLKPYYKGMVEQYIKRLGGGE
jgi:hypothetical protein